ncbi:MAG: Uncharacterised protein [Owenweeksia sp. TMED14]|nr:MAG: Uncharacterised protein [Owenweeksia sp. TMED14]
MKYLDQSFFLILLLSLCISNCDLIDEPFKTNPNPIDTSSIIRGDTLIQTQRAVLIEDFTGHRCKNCPKASKVISALDSLYGQKVVPMALHAGPSNFTGVNSDYPTDFTSQAGDDIATLFGIFALPLGLVQRLDYPDSHQKTYTAWSSLTNLELIQLPEALFTLTSSFDSSNRVAVLDYSVHLTSTQSGALGIAAYLKETGIISPQLMPNNTRNDSYIHNNVFRDAPLGPFGTEVSANGGVSGEKFSGTIATALDPLWNPEGCEWVMILYDRSNYRVLQPAAILVRP